MGVRERLGWVEGAGWVSGRGRENSFGNSVNTYESQGLINGRKNIDVLYYEGHYSSICSLGEEMIRSKTKSAASIKMANNSLVNASLMNFPALPNKKTSVFSFSSPVERKKKRDKTSPPAKINQQPKLIPEISNRFSVLSDLVFKPKTQNSVCSSSFSSVK